MDLDDYIQNNESVVTSVSALDGEYSLGDHRRGTLAVTPNRVVFVRNKLASDISLNGVDSIQYQRPTYPSEFLYGFAALFCASIILGIISWIGGEIGSTFRTLGWVSFVLSLIVLAVGFLFRRSKLTLNTSNKTFKFVSRDDSLINIAHALRGHEGR